MSLPLPAIDRLFDRLTATYGRDFTSKYEGLDMNAVKSSWAHELSGYEKNLRAIAWALETLPERPPNVIAFRALCRMAPATEAPRIEAPRADPERVKAELAKLAPLRMKAAAAVDRRDWARRIVKRHEAGERLNMTTLKMAKQALGFQPSVEAA